MDVTYIEITILRSIGLTSFKAVGVTDKRSPNPSQSIGEFRSTINGCVYTVKNTIVFVRGMFICIYFFIITMTKEREVTILRQVKGENCKVVF